MSRKAAPVGRRYDPDAAWKDGQGTLVFEREESFGGKLDLEHFELASERTDARFFEVFDDELVVAARLIDADAAAGEDMLAHARRESDGDISLSKHCAADLRIAILEREVPMA